VGTAGSFGSSGLDGASVGDGTGLISSSAVRFGELDAAVSLFIQTMVCEFVLPASRLPRASASKTAK
jgi:hypothetical protein